MRGTGRALLAATLLVIVGTLNIIYGIGALDGANIFVNDNRYILTDLNTMGWVLIVLGVIQLAGGFSLIGGNAFGRVIGIIGASLGAIGALLSIGGALPLVVAGHLLPVHLHRPRHLHLRRGEGAVSLSPCRGAPVSGRPVERELGRRIQSRLVSASMATVIARMSGTSSPAAMSTP